MDKIPCFPEFGTLDISHKPLIDAYLKDAQPKLSELNFSEIFAWHIIRDTKITSHNNNICLYLNKAGKKYFYPPFGKTDPAKTVVALLEWAAAEEPEAYFYCFDEDGAKMCEASGRLAAEEDRDNADYVYAVEDLISLSGRKFDGKRNHLKHFLRDNEFEFAEVTAAMIPEINEFHHGWCEARECDDDLSLMNEIEAMQQVLDNWASMDIRGAVIRIRGKIQAFTAASELNKETAVVLFEKASPEYRGIYQAINQQFCENMLNKYAWINREQDAGDEGLRKAKLSYNPARLETKYVVRLKG
jgi:hypothetical protein